jgi:hypothetical protein
MDARIDQPRPGVFVPALPAAPAIATVVERDALQAARARAATAFDAAAATLVEGGVPDFPAIAMALLQLADIEWRTWSSVACGASRMRLEAWYRAQSAFAAAVADLAQDPRDDELQRALLRRRTWQYADAFREALAWRRDEFGAPAAAVAD